MRNGIGWKVFGHDAAGPNHTAIANGYPRQNLYARTKPAIVADLDRRNSVGLITENLASRRDGVVCGDDATMHADQCLLAYFHAAVAIYYNVGSQENRVLQDDASIEGP
jgi:hypothetical protein